jgi:hypothetical protein
VLKKIRVGELQLGMHLQSFEGNWVSHPFWRKAFVLQNGDVLARARASDAQECWIDASPGSDVQFTPAAAPPVVVEALLDQPLEPPPFRTSM